MAEEAVSLEAGEAAREALKGRLVGRSGVPLRGWVLQGTALSAIRAWRGLESDGWLPRLAHLDGPEWSKRCLDEVMPAALALYAIDHALTKAAAQRIVLIPEPLWTTSGELKSRMQAVTEHNLYDEPKALEELADIRLGSGYQDRSADLNRLEALYIQHEAKLIQDRRYRPTDAADASRIATEILDAITNGESPEVRRLKAEASVVLGYLIEQYDELAAAGRFVLRKAGGAARLPSLRALSLG